MNRLLVVLVMLSSLGIVTGCGASTPAPTVQPTVAVLPATFAPAPTSTPVPTVPSPAVTAATGPGTITGTVRYNEEKPEANLGVQLWRYPYPQGGSPVLLTTTNADGRYVFTGVPVGQYATQVDYAALRARGYYQALYQNSTNILTIAPTSTVARVDWECVYKVRLVRPFDNKDLDYIQYPTVERTLTLKWEPLPDATNYAIDVFDEASGKSMVNARSVVSNEIQFPTEPGHKYAVWINAYRGQVFGRYTLGRYGFQAIAQ